MSYIQPVSRPLMLTLLLAIFSIPLFFFVNEGYANDSITVTISGNPTITVAPTSEGTFADSSNINISVSNAPSSGYTLAITGSNNTSLVGKTDNTKSITSISSALDQATFNTSTYNNKWGYKPSMHYNTSTGQRANNSNYLPSPDANGDIIDVTGDNSSNNYTLSIGARVTSDLGFQTYENNTFVIAAVANMVQCDNTKLCVQYDGNGLTYDGKTVNKVNYNSDATQGQVTKYSHTPNIDNAGTQSGDYPDDAELNDIVTILGASTIHLSFKYGGEVFYEEGEEVCDYTSIWQGSHPDYTAENDYASGIQSCGTATSNGGMFANEGSVIGPVECDIPGDTVTFGFHSDAGVSDNYGYYAVVTGTGIIYSRTTTSGEYITPAGTGAIFYGWSSTATTPGGGFPSQVEYADETAVKSKILGDNGDTETLYAVWQQEQSITFAKDSNVSSIEVLDSEGTSVGTITTSGQSLALLQGNVYTIKPTYITGYTTNSLTKTSGAGTITLKHPNAEFTVGAGTANINITSRTLRTFDQAYATAGKTKYNSYYTIQDMTSGICSNVDLANLGVIGQVIDTRDNEVYYVGKLKDNKCWMLDNLRLDLTDSTVLNSLTTSNTHVDATSLISLKSGNRSAGNQYAKNGFVEWDSSTSSSTNQAQANADYKDTTTTSWGPGSGKIGVYYNYCAASAGSFCYDAYSDGGSGNSASYDLCPAGWRMPTGAMNGEYWNLIYAYDDAPEGGGAAFHSALSTPLSGYLVSSSSSPYSLGSNGFYWASTAHSIGQMYALGVYSWGGTLDFRSRSVGFSMRCLLGS